MKEAQNRPRVLLLGGLLALVFVMGVQAVFSLGHIVNAQISVEQGTCPDGWYQESPDGECQKWFVPYEEDPCKYPEIDLFCSGDALGLFIDKIGLLLVVGSISFLLIIQSIIGVKIYYSKDHDKKMRYREWLRMSFWILVVLVFLLIIISLKLL